MTLYEIDQAILALVDEDGEIADFAAFEALQMERETKLEQTALWYKNLTSDADAIKAEREALKKREDALRRKAERLKGYLSTALQGTQLTTPRVAVSFRSSKAVEITPECEDWCRKYNVFTRAKEPGIDKTAIRDAIERGLTVPGAALVNRNNIQIK